FRNSAKGFRDHAVVGPRSYAQIPELAERGMGRTRDCMTDLNGYLAEREFVAGDQLTVADITALSTSDFAKCIQIVIPDYHSHHTRWYEAVSSRPSAKAQEPLEQTHGAGWRDSR